jgi:hypothetical protein
MDIVYRGVCDLYRSVGDVWVMKWAGYVARNGIAQRRTVIYRGGGLVKCRLRWAGYVAKVGKQYKL